MNRKIKSHLHFPNLNKVPISFKLDGEKKDQSYSLIGASITDLTNSTRNKLSCLIFKSVQGVTIKSMLKAGFSLKSTIPSIQIAPVKEEQDYIESLKLQKHIYLNTGKIYENSTKVKKHQPERSTNLIISKHQNKVVAAIDIIKLGIGEDAFFDRYIKRGKDFSKNNEFCILSNACVDYQYRGSDIAANIFKFATLQIIKRKKSLL